jgi:hypothetical protein
MASGIADHIWTHEENGGVAGLAAEQHHCPVIRIGLTMMVVAWS